MPKPIIKKRNKEILKKAKDICPVNVFDEKEGKIEVVRPDDCIGCKACESVCEDDEIEVVDD